MSCRSSLRVRLVELYKKKIEIEYLLFVQSITNFHVRPSSLEKTGNPCLFAAICSVQETVENVVAIIIIIYPFSRDRYGSIKVYGTTVVSQQ